MLLRGQKIINMNFSRKPPKYSIIRCLTHLLDFTQNKPKNVHDINNFLFPLK